MTLQEIARALGGEVNSGAVSAPGPGHSKHDRSMRVFIDPNSPCGLRAHSLAGDNWKDCLDYVKQRLGIADEPRQAPRMFQAKPPAKVEPDPAKIRASEFALAIWQQSVPVIRSPAAAYLASRSINPEMARSHALRFHPACPFRLEDGSTVRLPSMIALFTDIRTNEACGIHRTALKPDGSGKSDHPGLGAPKKMLGRVKGAAIKLSEDADVTYGLGVGEGIETCLSLMTAGWAPMWALGSAQGIASFDVLPGVESLHVFADADDAGVKAAKDCRRRWQAAGNDCTIILPPEDGTDWNDTARAP